MCGYSCTLCGRCGKVTKIKFEESELPGKCPSCGELNGPTSRVCKKCGAEIEVYYHLEDVKDMIHEEV